jgi:hypothetical protein
VPALVAVLVLFASACGSGDDGVRSEVTRGDAATTLAPPSSRPSTTVTSTTEPAPVVPPAPENAVEDLAEVVAACVPRADTPHPVFHGCIDWHSAVHGNYALRAAARLTGDDSYLAVAEEVVTAGSLDAERDAVASGTLGREVPYGFAWFLLLAEEAQQPAITAIASDVAERLEEWIRAHLDDEDALWNPKYESLPFALYALHGWYGSTDPVRAIDIRSLATGLAAMARDRCGRSRPSEAAREFFDPCAMFTLLLSALRTADSDSVAGADVGALCDRLSTVPPLSPPEMTTDHAAGLDFSRSWALYACAEALLDPSLVARGDVLVSAHLAMPQFWRDDYGSHAHWVPQFGIRALALRADAVAALAQGVPTS